MFGNSLTKFLKLDTLIENLTGYVETKVELIKVEVKQDIRGAIANAITYLIIAFVFAMVLLLLSIGTAMVLAQRLGNFWGFGIVAAFYLVAGIILFARREPMSKEFEKKLSETSKKKE
jgi:hypothetical protein